MRSAWDGPGQLESWKAALLGAFQASLEQASGASAQPELRLPTPGVRPHVLPKYEEQGVRASYLLKTYQMILDTHGLPDRIEWGDGERRWVYEDGQGGEFWVCFVDGLVVATEYR